MMKVMLDELKTRLIKEEGFRQYPYDDATGKEFKTGMILRGKLTVGVGYNLTDRGLEKSIIDKLLDHCISVAIDDALYIFPHFWGYSGPRQIVILDLLFAMGRPRFLGFEKMIKYIHNEQWLLASAELTDSQWARQVGTRAFELAGMLGKG